MKKTISIILALALAAGTISAQTAVVGEVNGIVPQGSYTPSFDKDGADEAPLNIILMIGDGMGLYHAANAMYANGGELTMMNLKTYGLVRTQSASDFTTDSAASGSAYACGQKTYNGAIGMDKDGKEMKNIPEKIAPKGIISGVISTDEVDGATPSAFFAHQEKRSMGDKIWGDLADSRLSFISAGSKQSYEKKDYETQDGISKRFTVVDNLQDPSLASADRIAYFPPKSEVASKKDGRGDFLPETTKYALEFLKNHSNKKKGFFLMVEGARIDKSSHGNDYPTMIQEVLDFDKAVTEAIKFAEADGHTLVLISADHETGALTPLDGNPAEGKMSGTFCNKHHTPSPVMLYAYGPSSRVFTGMQENSDVSNKIVELFSKKR